MDGGNVRGKAFHSVDLSPRGRTLPKFDKSNFANRRAKQAYRQHPRGSGSLGPNSTQFLVISQCKGTMEAADVLYSITMEASFGFLKTNICNLSRISIGVLLVSLFRILRFSKTTAFMKILNCPFFSGKYRLNKKGKIMNYSSKLEINGIPREKPQETSSGQQQREAIARALVCESEVILADEPTGALDQKTGENLLLLLKQINQEGKTILIVTHDSKTVNYANKIIAINDGEIV
ncbi:hypothetical protein SDC9_51775 [bioreactor metagenome]|nr:ATP-binding cassette domain-containing protein [Desulfitobacterium hafniense]EHL06355.1 ABC transporter, ATP-binding protein [Desulfitobacterium hafniense DP7]